MGRPQLHFQTTRVNLHVPNKLLDAAKALCEARSITLTEVIRNALREYLIRELKLERDLQQSEGTGHGPLAPAAKAR